MKKLIFFALTTLFVWGDMTLEVVKEVGNEPRIAIQESTQTQDPKLAYLREKFFKLIVADLLVTSHFDVDRTMYEEGGSLGDHKSDYILRYRLQNDEGRLAAKAELYDMQSKKTLYEKSYVVSDFDHYPFLAHYMVYDVATALGADDVAFLRSKVLFSQSVAPKRADIILSDYTLTYQKPLIKGGLNIFPKWADKERHSFYYTSMDERDPTLYRYDLLTAKRTKIVSSSGMLVCSDVSEDGSKLLLTMAPNYQPDIYLYDIHTKGKRRITTYPGIDVNGNFTQNDKQVVFVSNRLGYPTIFVKRVGARGVQRLVYHGRNNSSCTTHGEYVAFSSRESDNEFAPNTFNIYLASTASDYIRRLTTNGINIFPRFSQDGETLLFIKKLERQSGLGLVRLRYNRSYIYPLDVGAIQSIDW